ncbi:hypothetical protein [Type-E symbiont of Plautia stali]|uniref:hypothetical protein n=1 Tax=Type-E symbiont of Plautia stali TaxID=1560357 RepID=UPI002570F904|nr:hypothetical protein [Type-E symbiont of Plautia stali]
MDFNYIKTLPSAIETIKSNYEAFILENYKLDHIGLFHDENNLYAVVNNLTASGLSLQEVNKLYDHNFRTIGVPGPLFVEKQEESFIRVPLRNTFERVNLFGQFFNVSDFNNKMNMSLPLERHPFKVKISWVDNTLKFTFKKRLLNQNSKTLF